MVERLQIVIPRWHPATVNQLMSSRDWRKGASLKKNDREMIAVYSKLHHLPAARGKRRVSLHIVMKKRQRAADPDAYWKSTLDALVQAKLLMQDNRQNVELAPVIYSRDWKNWGTVIGLEDLA